jgi:hypothetical protein
MIATHLATVLLQSMSGSIHYMLMFWILTSCVYIRLARQKVAGRAVEEEAEFSRVSFPSNAVLCLLSPSTHQIAHEKHPSLCANSFAVTLPFQHDSQCQFVQPSSALLARSTGTSRTADMRERFHGSMK